MHTRLSSQVIRFILFASGPRWKRKNSVKLLWASRRHDASRRCKHSGNIADGLRCSTWRRAQTPGKMTHHISGTNSNGRGNIALVHPSKISRHQPGMLAKHSILAFLSKKISCFVHDCHPDWIARLNLPDSNGEHNQLKKHHIDRILRRLVYPNKESARLEHNRNIVLEVFIRLEISHGNYFGKQIVYSKPLMPSGKLGTRMDYVFFIPPRPFYTGRCRDFDLSLDNAWYGRVSLLFKAQFRTDRRDIREVKCAMIDVLFNYAEGR